MKINILQTKKLIPLIFILKFTVLQSQVFNPVTISSPNAAALGQYGDIPVDYCTGVPDISIPLYVLKEGNLNVPISLKYHASGIKPNQYPSWVGQNWTLFAGGSITRKVNGLPDEHDKLPNFTPCPNLGYFYNTAELARDNWDDFEFATNVDKITEKFIDRAPDEFSFSVNGISGKFYMGENGRWQVYCDQGIDVICTQDDIKSINFDYDNNSVTPFVAGNMFYKFILVSANGTKYIFGNNRMAIEYTRPENSSGLSIPTATTWNLTQIISPEGNNVINFEYERNGNDLIFYSYRTRHITSYTYLTTTANSGGLRLSSSIIEPSYLSKITSKHQKIEFSSQKSNGLLLNIPTTVGSRINSNYKRYLDISSIQFNRDGFYSIDENDLKKIGRKLDRMDIYYNPADDAPLFKSYVFKYIENNSERLKLQSLEEHASDELNFPVYNFEYYPKNDLPGFDTEKIDHWGYFNNSTPSEPDCISADCYMNFVNSQVVQDTYFDSRNPTNNPDVYLTDVLKKIVFPTKGYTVFEFEPHDYSSFIQKVPTLSNGLITGLARLDFYPFTFKTMAGGLRIKKITSSDNAENNIAKEFYYINDYQFNDDQTTIQNKLSSGQLQTGLPQPQGQECLNQYYSCLENRPACEAECARLYRHDDEAMYNCVSNCPECINNCVAYVVSPYISKGTYTGAIRNGTVNGNFTIFRSNPILPLTDNNGNHMVYRKVIEKSGNNGYTVFTYGLPTSSSFQYFDEVPVKTLSNSFYAKLTSKLLERNKLTGVDIYNNNGLKVKSLENYYNSLPSRYAKRVRSLSYDDLGFSISECPSCSKLGSANYIYFFNNYLEKQIEKIYEANGTDFISRTMEYKYNDYQLLTEKKTISSFNEVLIENYKYPNEYLSDLVTKSMFLSYHNFDTPVEAIKKKDNKVVSSTINIFTCKNCTADQQSGLLVNGFPKLLKTLELETSQPLTDYQMASSSLELDSRCKPKVFVDEYDNAGNVLQYHKQSDISTSYLWGYNNEYPVIKAENITSSALATAVTSIQSDLDDFLANTIRDMVIDAQKTAWKDFNISLRSALPVNTMITTYTYKPLVGLTSSTDPNGITTYYEYDTFGRLKCIKDDDGRILKTYEYHYKQ